MTIQEMRDKKRELGFSYEHLSELSGIPCSTIQKIFGGTTRYPRRVTIAALEKVLKGADTTSDHETDQKVQTDYTDSSKMINRGENRDLLREAGSRYEAGPAEKRKVKYSVIDYFHFPAGRNRCELIDGVIYDMASPTALHQGMSLRLAARFLAYVDDSREECRVFTAPFDVVPDPTDKYTVVQPDVMVVCDPAKLRRGYCEGAPDLVVEILSPSTRRRDLMIKHAKYAAAGVREYWIVDIDTQTVVVYDFEHEALPHIIGFGTPVPVGIWEGKCLVDFAGILAKL